MLSLRQIFYNLLYPKMFTLFLFQSLILILAGIAKENLYNVNKVREKINDADILVNKLQHFSS